MLNIDIKSIPDSRQRYNTVGDYWLRKGRLILRVSNMRNWRYEILVAVHELIEESLCKAHGVKNSEITKYDKEYEKKRVYGVLDQPGDNLNAPYHKEHMFATKVEKLLAKALGVNWKKYNEYIAKLDSE